MEKCIVLLSGGLDSTVNLLLAQRSYDVVSTLTFDYGQRAAAREIQSARSLSDRLGIRHILVPLLFFKEFTTTSLVSQKMDIPSYEDVDIQSVEKSFKSAEKVWVPNRNGIFLNVAAGFAEGFGAKYIVPGFNHEEAATFPDNSQAYQEALNNAFSFSTQNRVEVLCFTQGMMKTEILREGLNNGLNIYDLWPCYQGGETWCMHCESCLRFARALKENGITL